MKVLYRIGVVVLCCIGSLPAQEKIIKFTNLDPSDGLSQATVYDVLQDHLGFIWIGTSDGLNKYDGTRFEVYRHQPEDSLSISDSDIRFIYEDGNKRLWIGSSGGLDLLDRNINGFVHFHHAPERLHSLSSNLISDIGEDSRGQIWVATKHPRLQLHLFDPVSGEATRFENNIQQSPVNRILVDHRDQIWLLHENSSISGFSIASRNFFRIRDETQGEPLCIFQDSEQNIWIGLDEKGILKYIDGSRSWQMYRPKPEIPDSLGNGVVRDIIEETPGKFWIATDGGLNFFDTENGRFETIKSRKGTPDRLASNFLLSLLLDRTGRIWIGTTTAGLSLIDPQYQQFKHFTSFGDQKRSLSNNAVWSIAQSNDEIVWIGTEQGLNRLDRKDNSFQHYFFDPEDPGTISNNRIWSIHAENAQNLWLGTSGGLNHMRIDERGIPSFSAFQYDRSDPYSISANSIRTAVTDHTGTVWAGTHQDGLNRMDRVSGRFDRFKADPEDPRAISDNQVRVLFVDSKERLWVGTSNGLNLFHHEDESFQVFLHRVDDSTSLSNPYIRCLTEDPSGNIWVGTDEGLNCLVETTASSGETSFISRRLKWADNRVKHRVYSVEADRSGNIWLGTNDGLLCYSSQQNKFIRFNVHHGLQAKEFNQNASFQNAKGELFFGGINGLNCFYPAQVRLDRTTPPVLFTSLEILFENAAIGPQQPLQSHINIADQISLDYRDKTFSIGFVALNYNAAHRSEYAYRLVPFEEEWNFVGNQNFAYYTNIRPGDYNFQVKASNSDGLWNEQGASVEIRIAPAYWQTNWFKVLCAAFVLLLATAIYRIRVNALLSAKHQLERKVRERTEQLRSRKEELEQTLGDLRQTQTKLIHQEKMASLGQLTAGIAHEINNPINFIASSLKALKLDFEEINPLLDQVTKLKDQEEKEKYLADVQILSSKIDTPYIREEINQLLESIERGTTRTQNIISSLRTFSRDTREAFIEADINEAIESTLIILGNKLKRRIKVHQDLAKLPLIKCQLSKINQVILNIMANAIDAIEGEGEIFLYTGFDEEKITIGIRDTGIGMDQETQKRIFEPFFTTKEVGKGTGLGLAISYSIIEDHRGQIRLESAPGNGSEFIIELPRDLA